MHSSANDHFKALLTELADAGMEISREMLIGVRKAENQDERIAYAQGHDRAARSVRLSIALHDKLERGEREVAPMAPETRAIAERKAVVRAAVRRSIYRETEGEDAAMLETALDTAVEEYALTSRFADRPAGEVVRLVRQWLRLPLDMDVDLPWPEPAPEPAPQPAPRRRAPRAVTAAPS
jgi:hypothetical protein